MPILKSKKLTLVVIVLLVVSVFFLLKPSRWPAVDGRLKGEGVAGKPSAAVAKMPEKTDDAGHLPPVKTKIKAKAKSKEAAVNQAGWQGFEAPAAFKNNHRAKERPLPKRHAVKAAANSSGVTAPVDNSAAIIAPVDNSAAVNAAVVNAVALAAPAVNLAAVNSAAVTTPAANSPGSNAAGQSKVGRSKEAGPVSIAPSGL